jgi:transcriptional accessory protein Tex/SPT6
MNSLAEQLLSLQNQESKKEELRLAESVNKIIEELQKLGFDKKPEYTIPQADTIGKGYYSMYFNKK